jgi:hypothetical protein
MMSMKNVNTNFLPQEMHPTTSTTGNDSTSPKPMETAEQQQQQPPLTATNGGENNSNNNDENDMPPRHQQQRNEEADELAQLLDGNAGAAAVDGGREFSLINVNTVRREILPNGEIEDINKLKLNDKII